MKIFSLLLLFVSALPASAQEIIKTLTLSDTILYGAIDRPGDFYAITAAGQIQRFDKNGKLMALYKAETPPTLFDPRDGARLFAYYRDDQHYAFFTPSFQRLGPAYRIDPAFAIQPWLICPSGEYKLWVLDKADQTLKKINVRASEVEVEVLVDSTHIINAGSFTAMREYQGFVFLLDPDRGIHIFNGLGSYLRCVAARGIRSFNFLGEELYFMLDDQIEFFNLFTTGARRIGIQPGYTGALLSDERMILFTPQKIDIFPFRP
jgi:hypothetical protein